MLSHTIWLQIKDAEQVSRNKHCMISLIDIIKSATLLSDFIQSYFVAHNSFLKKLLVILFSKMWNQDKKWKIKFNFSLFSYILYFYIYVL